MNADTIILSYVKHLKCQLHGSDAYMNLFIDDYSTNGLYTNDVIMMS